MRWDDLLSEIEGRHVDESLLERDIEAAELAQGEWRTAQWVELLGRRRVTIHMSHEASVTGIAELIAADFVVLDDGRADVLVARRHVERVDIEEPIRREPRAPANLSWGQVARSWERDAERLVLTLAGGARIEGRVLRSGSDFLAVRAKASHVTVIPIPAIVTVHAPR